MRDVDGTAVQEGPELPHHLQLFAGQDADVCAAAQVKPSLVKDGVHRVLKPQRIHRLDGLRHLDGTNRVQFAVGVHRDVDAVTHSFACILVRRADHAQLLRGQCLRKDAGGHAEHLMQVVLVDGEALGPRADAFCPVLAARLVQHVHVLAMRVHGDRLAKAAAQQHGHGLLQQLARQIPERNVDAADGGDVADVVVHQRGHALPVHADVERVLAQEQRLHRLDARACDGSGCARFANAAHARIGVHADEAVAGHVVQRHRLDCGNFHLALQRRRKRPQVAKAACQWCHRHQPNHIPPRPFFWLHMYPPSTAAS